MSGHTPGPWDLYANSDYLGLTVTTGARMYAGKAPIAEVLVASSDEAFHREQLANGRLIAAAPDLLDALTAYHARHKCGCNHPACNDCERDRVAEAALGKARGEV